MLPFFLSLTLNGQDIVFDGYVNILVMGSRRNNLRTRNAIGDAWWAMSWERDENRKLRRLPLYLPPIIILMMTDNAYGG